jgi:hypothetical protein
MSGIFDVYKPTDPTPDNPGLVRRVGRYLRGLLSGQVLQEQGTTEAGVSTTASPSVEEFDLWRLRYERRAVIEDVARMILDDPRLERAAWKVAREAVRTGVKATVVKTAKRGPVAGRYRRAQEIVDRTLKECKITPAKLRGWSFGLTRDGDLFIQWIVKGNRIVGAKRMPAAGMERLTDSQDRFFDVERAFDQLDVQNDTTIASFAAWQIHHERWKHIDGERYGQSQYISLRKPARKLDLMEQGQVIRRITRAPLRLLHSVGTKEDPGLQKDVDEYKALNNLNNQSKGGFDPKVATRDFFANGRTTITAIPGDPNLEKIDDLEYFADVYAAGMGPPKAMLGFSSEDINRDILKDQIDEWLKEVQDLTDAILSIVRGGLEMALLLEGIDPTTVELVLTCSQNSTETAAQRADRATKLRQNTRGFGACATPDPLIPRRLALQTVAEDMGIEDVDAVLEELDAEEAALRERAEADAQAAAERQAAIAPPPQEADPDDPADPAGDEPADDAPKRSPAVRRVK